MTDNIEILEVPHREYDESRDWLVTDDMPRRRSAEIVQFTPKFLRCSICASTNHRASACPARPRPREGQPFCSNND